MLEIGVENADVGASRICDASDDRAAESAVPGARLAVNAAQRQARGLRHRSRGCQRAVVAVINYEHLVREIAERFLDSPKQRRHVLPLVASRDDKRQFCRHDSQRSSDILSTTFQRPFPFFFTCLASAKTLTLGHAAGGRIRSDE